MAQHDYIIANQSGASFRADLNNGLAAVVSQNSGAAEPSTTYAYMTWAVTTTGLYKIRNGANSAWIPLYKLDGTGFSVANGTAAAPSIFFRDSGTDTGIYSSGTDAVDVATAGIRRVGVSSAGDVTIYGQGDLRLADSDSSNYVGLQAPSTVSSNVVFTLPGADGAAGLPLKTDGAGGLTFGTLGAAAMASGLVLKVQHFTDAGTNTNATSFTNANASNFSYTPVSSNSTLIMLATFNAINDFVSNQNYACNHRIAGPSIAYSPSYTHLVAGSGGGSGYEMAAIHAVASNTSTSARTIYMEHHTVNLVGARVYTTNIEFTVIEVAN